MTKIQILRAVLILITGLSIAAFIAYKQVNNTPTEYQKFGGTYEMTNHLGERVTHKDFENQYRLIYFGFTYCPAICPTELNRITQVLNNLPEPISSQITPMFITIDPERDDVTTIKNYIASFHPNFIGLTGTLEETKIITDAYKIYAAKVKDETMTEYTMDHSSYIYLMAPDDRLIKIFKMDDEVEDIVKNITSVL